MMGQMAVDGQKMWAELQPCPPNFLTFTCRRTGSGNLRLELLSLEEQVVPSLIPNPSWLHYKYTTEHPQRQNGHK